MRKFRLNPTWSGLLFGMLILLSACTTPTTTPTAVPEIPTIVMEPLIDTPVAPTTVTDTPAGPTATDTPIPAAPDTPTLTLPPTGSTGSVTTADDIVVQFPAGSTGTSLQGSVAPDGLDVYRLTALENQLLSVKLTSSDPGNSGISMFAPGGEFPFVMADAGFVPTDWKGTLVATGEYRIEVYTFNQETTYTLDLNIQPNNATEPEIGADHVIQFGPGESGTQLSGVLDPEQTDIFRLTAGAGQQMNINLYSDAETDSGFTLFGPTQAEPIVTRGAGLYSGEWKGLLPENGQYRIELFNGDQPATYILEVEILPATTAGPEGLDGYILDDAIDIGEYRFEVWAPSNGVFGLGVGRLLQSGNLIEAFEFAQSIDPLSGRDINGNGTADLLINGYSGGAHCCFSLDIFDLGSSPTNILSLDAGNCGASPVDLNGDGIFEIGTCDDSFAYRYCAYAGSPKVDTYYSFDGTQYRPTIPNDTSLYSAQIPSATEFASQGSVGGWDETNKCGVLWLALIHLYSGAPTAAYQALQQYYTGNDLPYFWADLLNTVSASDMYIPTGTFPTVEYPAYYDIWLETVCDPTGYGLFLSETGQEPCQNQIGNGIFYFEDPAIGGPILNMGESILFKPDGCTTDCSLEISQYDFQTQTQTTVGQLRLVRTEGQPTGVERLDTAGQVVAGPFYLRGDLSWEQR